MSDKINSNAFQVVYRVCVFTVHIHMAIFFGAAHNKHILIAFCGKTEIQWMK